jgi:hypothetical protein
MSRGLFASVAALAVAAVAALPAGGTTSSVGLRVAIIGPHAAEARTWTELRVDVANLGNEELKAHATLILPYATTQPGEATGGRCSGTHPVTCDLTLPEAASRWLTLPVRWLGHGMWSVEARVRSDATQTSTSLSAASSTTVAVYGLKLIGLRTTPAQAGERLVASGMLTRSDTGTALRAQLLRCPATVGGRTVRAAGRIAGTRVTCTWAVPAGTSGQSFRGAIAASTHPAGTPTLFPLVRRIG